MSKSLVERVLVHVSETERRPVEPAEVYVLEADDDDTLVRLRGRGVLRDRRGLGELMAVFEPHGFVRIHRNHAVNLSRILRIRRRRGAEGWEIQMDPPVNRVLPVSRGRLAALWKAFGEKG
jgi:DNA-binding LytR/AlgR family response regulator